MNSISGYDNDVYISYSYIDNLPVGDKHQGWVDILHKRLQLRLAQLFGEHPKIWRDSKLGGRDMFDEANLINLSKSATLICVLSPAYTKSEWCSNELREFYNRAGKRAGITIGDRSRIIKVVKTPVPYSNHPPELQDFIGYEFYSIDPTSGRAREFDAQTDSNKDVRYWERFEDLAHDLMDVIRRIRQQRSDEDQRLVSPADIVPPSNVIDVIESESSRPLRVFLCHSSGDKPAVRDLYHRLRADGIDPWLDEENLLPGKKWELEIPKAVRNCDVVLVCLSQSSVNKKGYVQKEIKFALDVADEQPEDTIFLIPLRLEECELPERIVSYQWVNIYEEGGYDKLMRSLRACSSTLSVTGKIAT